MASPNRNNLVLSLSKDCPSRWTLKGKTVPRQARDERRIVQLRIVFMGSPAFAVPSLNALVEAGHDVIAVYSQPPRPAGRGKDERKTAVHERAGPREAASRRRR